MAVYLGEVDESKLDNMSIPFFNSVLGALGKKVNYDAVVNYAGNSFAKDSWNLIQEANPLIKREVKKNQAFMQMVSSAIKVQKKDDEALDWVKAAKLNAEKNRETEESMEE